MSQTLADILGPPLPPILALPLTWFEPQPWEPKADDREDDEDADTAMERLVRDITMVPRAIPRRPATWRTGAAPVGPGGWPSPDDDLWFWEA